MVDDEMLLNLYGALRRKISKDVNAMLQASGLGLRQFVILRTLADGGQHKVGELTEVCMTDAGTVSRSLAQLESAGLVEKVQSTEDRRVWVVKLSRKGRGKVSQIRKLNAEISHRLFENLTSEEKEDFARLLTRLAG